MSEASHIEQLRALFPDIEREVASALLDHHGSIERVVAALLDEGPGDAEVAQDTEVARHVQEGIDAELAAALQQEINEERRQQAASQSTSQAAGQVASQGAAAASAAAERVAAGAKKYGGILLQRARQLSTKSRGAHAQRLLDDSAPSDVNQPIQAAISPLYSPPMPYSAPIPAVPTPPPPAMPLTPATSSTRTAPEEGDGAPSRERSNSPPNKQYNSRLERARTANRSMSRSTPPQSTLAPLTVPDVSPSALAPLAAPPMGAPVAAPVEVPVGELI